MTAMGTVKMDELSADEHHEALLETVKGQVKAIMEESVTKKFVHEESEHVLKLCATIQTCLLDRLRKRTAGFLRTNKIANLFNKIGKSIPEVSQLIVKIEEAESAYGSQYSGENKRLNGTHQQSVHTRQLKQIWVRLALTEKLLDKILEHLVDNSSKFYEKQAILSDPVRGRILASLLVGPCALEYTKMKTADHYWSDPPADELLQRHKLHCRSDSSSSARRPALQSATKYRSADPADKNFNSSADGSAFRDYVESLHQNSKSTLLYGKNNVVVQPREELYPIPGYLSLHQFADSLHIKWTPNQLMNANTNTKSVNCSHEAPGDREAEPEGARPLQNGDATSSRHNYAKRKHISERQKELLSFWEYAISVNVRDVVYLHCHHRSDEGGTLVLVGQDGVQRPPICFPPGGHLLAFLTCLETGLLPHGHLDPPLWSQHGKGKVFPKLRNRSSHSSSSSAGSQSEAEEATDFVFRVTTGNSSMIYVTGMPESGPPAEKAVVPPTPDHITVAEQILATLFCDPFAFEHLGGAPKYNSKKIHLKKRKRPHLIPRTVIIKNSVGASSVSYDKKLFFESTIAPPSTFPHLHLLFFTPEDGGPGPSDRSSPNPACDASVQDLPTSMDRNPINDSFNAYSVSNYSFYGSEDSEQRSKGNASRSSLKVLCDTMRRQIISRAFYGWLAHCRHLSTVRTHLSALVLPDHCHLPANPVLPVDDRAWKSFLKDGKVLSPNELMHQVYLGGIKHEMRRTIWPFLLGHYSMESDAKDREQSDIEAVRDYERVMGEWILVERIVKQREKESLAVSLAKLSSGSPTTSISSFDGQAPPGHPMLRKQSTLSDVFVSLEHDSSLVTSTIEETIVEEEIIDHGEQNGGPRVTTKCVQDSPKKHIPNSQRYCGDHTPYSSLSTEPSTIDRGCSNITTNSISLDTHMSNEDSRLNDIYESDGENSFLSNCSADTNSSKTPPLRKQAVVEMRSCIDHVVKIEEDEAANGFVHEESSVDHEHDTPSAGASYTAELLDSFGLNLHRIEKDVHRCDRNHDYFANAGNLDKLRNIMCSYVWRHLDSGYMQGMCDLAAPLLVILDDENLVYSCFTQLMKRMGKNFPNGGAMDSHFANMRSLIQILDSELFEHMHRNGDYTHFYFCYRWFLLDFKRELSYEEDVFSVWERIWAARHVCSEDFVLFFALALMHNYRDIILTNGMDFTDIIKFFNEMAERHDAEKILQLAQQFVYKVQSMISK